MEQKVSHKWQDRFKSTNAGAFNMVYTNRFLKIITIQWNLVLPKFLRHLLVLMQKVSNTVARWKVNIS